MKKSWDGAVCYWERFCGLMMGVALVIALVSLGPRWSRTESELYMSSWYDPIILGVWVFACVGIVLSHINNAKGRLPTEGSGNETSDMRGATGFSVTPNRQAGLA